MDLTLRFLGQGLTRQTARRLPARSTSWRSPRLRRN